MTWIEKLADALPNSSYVRDADETMVVLCPYKFFGGNAPNYNKCSGIKCRTCWNSEVTEHDVD